MGISVRRSFALLGVATLGLAGLPFLDRDRIAFVARCSWNGNEPSVCWCTHRALPDLPSVYREAAISWSHQSSVEYAQTIMTAAAWRVLNHATGVDKDMVRRAREKKPADWVAAAASKTGWWAASRAARKIGGSSLGLAVKALPIVLHEGGDLITANAAMQRACGDRPHFLYRSAQLQQAINDTASGTWDRVVDASSSAHKTSVDSTSSAWGWVKHQASRLWPW